MRSILLPKRFLSLLVTLPLATICGLSIAYVGGFGGQLDPLRAVLGVAAALLLVALPLVARPRVALATGGAVVALTAGLWLAQKPSNARNWEEPSSRTAWARVEEVDGRRLVTIHDVRDFRYDEDGSWRANWYDATYDLSELEGSYFILTRFGGIDGLAHVMVSFRFRGDRFIVLSVEIRREDGERYDPIGGALRQYELLYVAADERDALALRTHVHKDETWVIPINAGPEKTGEFFVSMVERMTALHERPQWYNTLTSSCATNLAAHYQHINDVRFPPDYRVLLPGFSDAFIAELGLLPDGMSVEEARARYHVNPVAEGLPVDANFSTAIRR